jgi:hypothetical protein
MHLREIDEEWGWYIVICGRLTALSTITEKQIR